MFWRRRNYLVRRRFQVRFITLLLLQMSVILASIGLVVFTHSSEVNGIAANIPFAGGVNRTALLAEVVDNAHGFYVRSLVLLGFTTLLMVLFGLLASHRLAGPLFKLERYLNTVADGDYSQKIAFRRQDFLDDFATQINSTMESLEDRRLQARELGIELFRRARKLDGTPDRDHMVAEMEGLVSGLRGAISCRRAYAMGLTVPRTGATSPRSRKRAATHGYSPTIAAKLTGLNYNTILYWVRTKLVRASVQYESKQWTPVLFSFDDLLELKFIQSLRDKGAPTRRIRKALNFLRKEVKNRPLSDLYLDVTTDDIQLLVSSDKIVSAAKNQGQLLLINVDRLRGEIEEKAKKANIQVYGIA